MCFWERWGFRSQYLLAPLGGQLGDDVLLEAAHHDSACQQPIQLLHI